MSTYIKTGIPRTKETSMSSSEAPMHFSVAINRFIDLSLTFFNSLVALMLLTAGWYKVTLTTEFQGCSIPRGTVLAPFSSGFCDIDTFTELENGGEKWKTMHNYCITYMAFALAISSLVGYEAVVHGLRKWSNANTMSFVLNMVLLIIQSMILIENSNVPKPPHIENELATTMIIAALTITCVRVPMLGWFMYHTYTYDRKNGGYFGTGSNMF